MKGFRGFILLSILLVPYRLYTSPECVDNSWHMTQPNDAKEYHRVTCNCPCGSYSSSGRYTIINDRGRCTECRHFRFVRPPLKLANPFIMSKGEKIDPRATALALHYMFTRTRSNTD